MNMNSFIINKTMKFSGYIDINKPINEVAEFFINPKYLKYYQDGFTSKDLTKGIEGKEGAESNILFIQGKRKLHLKETIIKNDLPLNFEAFYQHKHMDNTMQVNFEVIEPNITRYHYTFEYVRVSWVMPKLMMKLFPTMFKEQPKKWLNQFKEFVEKQ